MILRTVARILAKGLCEALQRRVVTNSECSHRTRDQRSLVDRYGTALTLLDKSFDSVYVTHLECESVLKGNKVNMCKRSANYRLA